MKFRFASGLMSLRDTLRQRRTGAAAPSTPASATPEREAQAAKLLVSLRGRASYAAAPRAGKAAAALLRPLLKSEGIGLSEIKRRWADIVGPSFADKTAPEKLAAGVLTLRAPSALAPFLQQQAPLLIERLRLGGAAIKSIRIEQRALPTPHGRNVRPLRRDLTPIEDAALSESLAGVDDPRLRAALLRLGRAVKRP